MFPVIRTLYKFVSEDYRRTPALRCVVPLIVGIVAHQFISISIFAPAVLIATIVLGTMAAILMHTKLRRSWLSTACEVLLWIAICIFGLQYAQMRQGTILPYSGKAHINGWVSSIFKANDYGTHVIVEADSITTNTTKYEQTKGYLKVYDPNIELIPGEKISADVWIKDIKPDAWTTIDEQTWLNEHKFQFSASADSIVTLGSAEKSVSTLIWHLRLVVRQRLAASGLSTDNINIMMALLMGDRSQLSSTIKQQFSDCGIIHILAVSGMHVALIYGIINFLLLGLRQRNRKFCCIVVIVALWVYAIICGMSPSVFRAVIMMSIVEIGCVRGRTPDLNNTLSVAAIIILLVSPSDIYNLGFWLSFVAVWGLANLSHVFNGRNPFAQSFVGRYIYGSGTMSFVAQISTAPISLFAFHRFPVYFLIHNIMLIWLIAPIVCLTFLSVLDGGFIQIGIVTNLILDAFQSYIRWVSTWPYAVIENISFGMPQAIFALLTLYALSWAVSNKWFSWQIGRVWLTVGTCFALFFGSCIVQSIITSQRDKIVIYSAGQEMGITIVEGSECAHILTDTTNYKLLRRARNIEQKLLATPMGIHTMYDGMIIKTPSDTLLIVGNKNRQQPSATTTLVVGTATPPCTALHNVIVAPSVPHTAQWEKLATGYFRVMQNNEVIDN